MTVDGERIDLDAWPGMIGHNWGAEHAERWTWIQANDFREGDGYFDAAVGRIKVGRLTTPWVGNGILSLDGERHRLGGFDRIRSTRIEDEPTRCEFELTGKDIRVRGRVSSEPRNFVAWIYADPKGPEHNTLNCSISDVELTVERKGRAPQRLVCVGAGAYELGMRETDHGIRCSPTRTAEGRPRRRAGRCGPHRWTNRAHVDRSSSLSRSVTPLIAALPAEPTTRARTILGESPRSSTSIRSSLPSNRPVSSDSIRSSESRSVHRCSGEASSKGSFTDRR